MKAIYINMSTSFTDTYSQISTLNSQLSTIKRLQIIENNIIRQVIMSEFLKFSARIVAY